MIREANVVSLLEVVQNMKTRIPISVKNGIV